MSGITNPDEGTGGGKGPLGGVLWYRQRGAALSFLTLLTLLGALGLLVPDTFYSATNLENLAGQLPALLLAALGQTFVLLGAGFDLSVGATISLSSAIFTADLPTVAKVPLGFAAAAAVGTVNGVGCVYLRVHPIIMTLATASMVQGLALIILPTPGGTAPPSFVALANGAPFGVPAGLIWMVCAAAAAIAIVHGTRFGTWLFATGENPESARMSGVPAARLRIATYVISALCAALAGVYLTGRLASGDPVVGNALGLDSVLGAALGGTLLSGGIGGPIGTVSGVLIIGAMNNGLNLMGVSPFYQYVAKGALLIGAVSLFRRREAGL